MLFNSTSVLIDLSVYHRIICFINILKKWYFPIYHPPEKLLLGLGLGLGLLGLTLTLIALPNSPNIPNIPNSPNSPNSSNPNWWRDK